MRQINLVEGKVVAPEGMKVGILRLHGYREHLRFR